MGGNRWEWQKAVRVQEDELEARWSQVEADYHCAIIGLKNVYSFAGVVFVGVWYWCEEIWGFYDMWRWVLHCLQWLSQQQEENVVAAVPPQERIIW